MKSAKSDRAPNTRLRVGVAGASGYVGFELLRLIRQHPHLDLTVVAAGRAAGSAVQESWPALTGLAEASLVMQTVDVDAFADRCDAVFLALPHGVSAPVAAGLLGRGVTVVDLGADFRLKDPATYERYYGAPHPHPELLEQAVYGLVEFNREALVGATLIANPGCYPTAVALAARPLVDAGWCDGWLVADCLSGVSGAGRNPTSSNMFCTAGESARAYGVGGQHRHTPEIEQTLGVQVTFNPHLVPMSRGMVATVHIRLDAERIEGMTLSGVRGAFDRYAEETMVVLRDDVPSTADVRGTNRAHIHVALDRERRVITAVCVIDNLVKGAAGQAVQALNVAKGFDEISGLPRFPLLP
ncbi:MAG: N-acetyl-gamma-glutamyl-phosphate reductase [Myxococcota bacterium]|jgi:N-acetyl-gamma-glutamyl-phosphate reductase